MGAYALIAASSVALAVLQAGFVSALPFPANAVHVPLVLIVGLIVRFRFDGALIAAAAAGVAADALSAGFPGVRTALLIGVAAALIAAFTTVFTNHSWPGIIGLNVCGFLLLRASIAATSAIGAWLAGVPAGAPSPAALAAWSIVAIAAQLLVVAAASGVRRAAARAFSSFFIMR
jgi:hypothetical protein